jgi:hypothetical protein
LRLNKAHFGLRRHSEVTTVLFRAPAFSQKKSGVALRFPPHSKNVAVVEETNAITSNRQSPASTLKYLYVWPR